MKTHRSSRKKAACSYSPSYVKAKNMYFKVKGRYYSLMLWSAIILIMKRWLSFVIEKCSLMDHLKENIRWKNTQLRIEFFFSPYCWFSSIWFDAGKVWHNPFNYSKRKRFSTHTSLKRAVGSKYYVISCIIWFTTLFRCTCRLRLLLSIAQLISILCLSSHLFLSYL